MNRSRVIGGALCGALVCGLVWGGSGCAGPAPEEPVRGAPGTAAGAPSVSDAATGATVSHSARTVSRWLGPAGPESVGQVDGMGIEIEDLERLRAAEAGSPTLTNERREALVRERADQLLLTRAAIEAGVLERPEIQQVLVNAWLQRDVYGPLERTPPDEDRLRAWYEQHGETLGVPLRARVRQLIVRGPDSAARITALAQRIEADPGSFEAIARAESEGPFRRQGGAVGWVTAQRHPGLEPSLLPLALSLEPGVLSEPQVLPAGHALLRVEERSEARIPDFEEARGAILRRIRSEQLESARSGLLDELRRDATVEIERDRLYAWWPADTPPRPEEPRGSE